MPKSRGRPTKTPGVHLSHRLVIRLSPDDMMELRGILEGVMPVGEFLRRCIRQVILDHRERQSIDSNV